MRRSPPASTQLQSLDERKRRHADLTPDSDEPSAIPEKPKRYLNETVRNTDTMGNSKDPSQNLAGIERLFELRVVRAPPRLES